MVGLFSRVLEAVKPQQQTRREEDAKTKNVTRIRNAAKKIEKVKTICDLGKMHARSMRDNSLDPDVLASERKNYEMYKHDAIVVMGSLRDTTLRELFVAPYH